MQKLATLLLIGFASAPCLLAGVIVSSPEIDAATGAAAITLLAGSVLVLRARRRK
jgi:hypothetical protein